MRWMLLCLPTGLLVGLVLYVARPEAQPQEVRTEKVSSEAAPEKNPVAFLAKCLAHYDKKVKGYSVIFVKQERIDGRLQKPEEILVHFRDKPYSVYFQWRKGARQAEKALWVDGENKGQMLARPKGFIARKIVGDIVARDLDSSEAKQSARYPLSEFGIRKSTDMILGAWKKADKHKTLHVEYLGVHKVKELGDRLCYKFHRTKFEKPEDDGITDTVILIDKETMLQTGTILSGENGLIATYFFKDVKLNPTFKAEQFQRDALKP